MTLGHNNNAALEALIIGTSPAACRLREMIRRVARSNASVMLCGPSGSGKELVARAIHDEGVRAGKAFSAINCGAIPGELIPVLFSPYKAQSTVNRRNPGGLGLGLYIAREIAAGHGGSLAYSYAAGEVLFTLRFAAIP